MIEEGIKLSPLEIEALRVDQYIQSAERSQTLNECAIDLNMFLGTVKASQFKDIYEPSDAEEIFLNKLYQEVETQNGPFYKSAQIAISTHAHLLDMLEISKENAERKFLQMRKESYGQKLAKVSTVVAAVVKNGGIDIDPVFQYEHIKSVMAKDIGSDETQFHLDKKVYLAGIIIIKSNLMRLIEKANPLELATDKHLDHYDACIERIKLYKEKALLDNDEKKCIDEEIGDLNNLHNKVIDPVRNLIEKEQDKQYNALVGLVKKPEPDFNEFNAAFQRFKDFTLMFQRVLEDSPEDLKQIYDECCESMKCVKLIK